MREASPQSSEPLWLGGGCCHLKSVISRAFVQPRTPFCLPHPPGLAPKLLYGERPQSTGFRHHGSGKLFAQLAGGGSRGRGPRKPASGNQAWASTEMVEGGAQSLGCGEQIDPLASKTVGRLVSRVGTPGKNQHGPQAFLGRKWHSRKQELLRKAFLSLSGAENPQMA